MVSNASDRNGHTPPIVASTKAVAAYLLPLGSHAAASTASKEFSSSTLLSFKVRCLDIDLGLSPKAIKSQWCIIVFPIEIAFLGHLERDYPPPSRIPMDCVPAPASKNIHKQRAQCRTPRRVRALCSAAPSPYFPGQPRGSTRVERTRGTLRTPTLLENQQTQQNMNRIELRHSQAQQVGAGKRRDHPPLAVRHPPRDLPQPRWLGRLGDRLCRISALASQKTSVFWVKQLLSRVWDNYMFHHVPISNGEHY